MRQMMKMVVACAAVGLAATSAADVVRKLVLIGGYGDWENGQIVAFAEKKTPSCSPLRHANA